MVLGKKIFEFSLYISVLYLRLEKGVENLVEIGPVVLEKEL